MDKVKPIDSIYDLKWQPRIMIEASAGTGKTYTLTALYLRLLLEKKLEVEQILVMTFTKKATAELKQRIFRRLKECLNRLVTGVESEDDFANELYSRIQEKDTAIEQLQRAIRNFDDSQVYTIHGFCQKVLKEEALLARTPFEFEVVQQDELLAQASEDFWRKFMDHYSYSEAGRYYISKLIDIATSPSELRDKLEPIFSKSYARLEGEGMEKPIEYLENILSIRKELVRCWTENEQILLEILRDCDVSRYQQHLGSRLRKLRTFIYDDSLELDKPESLKYFTSEYLYDPGNLPKTGNPKPTQRHSFFELCSKFEKEISGIEKVKTTLIREAFREIKKIRNKLSIDSSTVTYDDLLKRVEESLVESDHSDELSGALLRKYPAALVDEFQDTDPIQYNILKSIYTTEHADTSLLMIGDPKQAIYGFRGADIYTYIKARD
ncbi:MAG: UvrD-helicase domain-containing protein, partial [Bacteroidetes bacterium]|nr:UvrD-helicase domain-containing protein [Bacteroidota bacterium]